MPLDVKRIIKKYGSLAGVICNASEDEKASVSGYAFKYIEDEQNKQIKY